MSNIIVKGYDKYTKDDDVTEHTYLLECKVCGQQFVITLLSSMHQHIFNAIQKIDTLPCMGSTIFSTLSFIEENKYRIDNYDKQEMRKMGFNKFGFMSRRTSIDVWNRMSKEDRECLIMQWS